MKLNNGQRDAVQKALEWYFCETDKKKYFILAGYAGTGKSSTVNTLVNMLGLMKYQVLFVAPTGKAASVLRSKGCLANTIHKTFYTVRKSEGKIFFNRKKNLSTTIKLIVVDEVSMVNNKMFEDILGYNIPVLAMGDPAQLPPIYGANKYLMNPDVVLTEVMRQAGDSGILKLATMARNGENIPLGTYFESDVINASKIKDIEKYDTVICWKNSTRHKINDLIRKKLGYNSKLPMKGEKVICLKNNYDQVITLNNDIPIYLVNGMSCVALEDAVDYSEKYYKLKFKPTFVTSDQYYDCLCKKDIYSEEEDIATDDEADSSVAIDFGYALTSFKSQGSEACNVLLIDEFKCGKDLYKKHLYTGITRAKTRLTIAYSF